MKADGRLPGTKNFSTLTPLSLWAIESIPNEQLSSGSGQPIS